MQEKQFNKYLTLLGLYVAQSIPMSFFSTVVPVIMRQEHYSLESIGLLQLIKLPWIFKFLWAPIVDKSANTTGQYKRWIVYSELFYATVILFIGFFKLQTDFTLIVMLMLLAFTASATQDIATDALAILTLRKNQRGLGNSMQSAGSFLGTTVGSGVLLLIYNYLGWQAMLAGLACFVLLALIPLKWFRYKPVQPTEAAKIKWADILYFFTQKNIIGQIIFLFLCYSGLIGVLAILKPLLVDLGYNMKEIGFMSGIIGTITASLCALGAGYLVKWAGLYRCMPFFATVIFGAPLYFWWMSCGHYDRIFIQTGICLLWGAYGVGTIMVYTTAMIKVRPGREGTDFTIQTVLTHLSGLLIAIGSSFIAGKMGYKTLFIFEATLAMASLLYVVFIYRKNNRGIN